MPSFVQPLGGGGFVFQNRMPGSRIGGSTTIRQVIGGGHEELRQNAHNAELRKRQLAMLDQLLAGGGFGGAGPVGNPFQAGIDKIAASRRAEIQQGAEDALNTSLARLQDRGLGGSTFSLNAEKGADESEQQSLNNLAGDIGALEIRGQEAAMSLADRQRQQQMQFLQQLLGQVF